MDIGDDDDLKYSPKKNVYDSKPKKSLHAAMNKL
jgi:hypothetical protein